MHSINCEGPSREIGHAIGFNDAGICFTANNVQPLSARDGVGRHFIARSLLESRSLPEAVAAVHPPDRAYGFNYTIGHNCWQENSHPFGGSVGPDR